MVFRFTAAAADALSRMYPIQQTENTSIQTQKTGESDNEAHLQENQESEIVLNETNGERLPYEDNEPIAVRLQKKESKEKEKIFEEYCTWKSNRVPPKIKFKPTTNGINSIKISKQNIFSVLRIQVPDFNEEIWMKLLYIKLKDFTFNKNWKILKFHLEDPSINLV